MMESPSVQRRRQYCLRCSQLMFEYYRPADGHFGLVNPQEEVAVEAATGERVVRCPACRAPYRVLARINAMGQPVERK
jgi:hypothetical protein